MIQNTINRKISYLEILQYTLLISVLLYFGKALFIPLSFAILISFILYPMCKSMEKKGVPKSVAIFIALLGMILLISLIAYLFFLQIISFSKEWHFFSGKRLVKLKATN